MRARYLLSILVISLFCSVAGIGTLAWFTSSSVSEGNTFTAGTLRLGSDSQEGIFATFTDLSYLAPDETISSEPATIKNVGTLPLRLYRVSAEIQNNEKALEQVVTAEILINEVSVYLGKLGDLSTTIEDNTNGYFEPIGPINPGNSLDISVVLTMDEDVDATYQGALLECAFTVYAEQINAPDRNINQDPEPVTPNTVEINTQVSTEVKLDKGGFKILDNSPSRVSFQLKDDLQMLVIENEYFGKIEFKISGGTGDALASKVTSCTSLGRWVNSDWKIELSINELKVEMREPTSGRIEHKIGFSIPEEIKEAVETWFGLSS